jgi:type II protein arginine methyltransferase
MNEEEERVPTIRTSAATKIRVAPEYYLQHAHQEAANGNNVKAIQNYIYYMDNLTNMNDMKVLDLVSLTKLILNMSSSIIEPTAAEEDEIMKCYTAVINNFPENVILRNAFGVYFFGQGEYTVSAAFLEVAAKLGYLPAEKNYMHVMWHLIPRWHFRMLNDRKRNESYRDAIRKAVKSGYKNVCDIGTGCGLLSLIAASLKGAEVTAIEENKFLFNIAQTIFEKNKAKVNLIHSNSTQLTSLSTPCNLIVTEIFDAALFGENCLRTIKHALDTFVSEEKFKVIPASAKVYVTAFRSPEMMRKARYTEQLKELGLEDVCLIEIAPEPYDAEYLKNKNLQYVSETKPFLTVNFSDKKQLDELLTPDNDAVDEVELICTEDGAVHALAIWFDLSLDEDITISTNPFNSDVECWEQGVYHLTHPVQVKKDEVLKIKPRVVEGQITFTVVGHNDSCPKCFEVSTEVISFLNDVKLVETITKAVERYDNCDLRIVDFNVFPLFGLLMAKKGATVYHVYKDECDLNLYKYLMEVNQLSNYKMIFIHERAMESYMVYLEPPDVVYTDVVKTDGSWNKMELSIESESKLDCVVVPKKIFLKAQFISSKYLDVCNRVDDSKALNFKIAAYLNEFSGTEHPNIEHLECEKHSTIVTFDVSDADVFDLHMETIISEDGICNAILYWFDFQFTDDESITFSTLDSYHYDKTCTLLQKPKAVKKGDKIMIHVLRYDGHLKVYCDENNLL